MDDKTIKVYRKHSDRYGALYYTKMGGGATFEFELSSIDLLMRKGYIILIRNEAE